MGLIERDKSLVLLIDFQGKLMEMVYKPERLVQGAIRIIKLSEIFEVPILLSEQYPKGLGRTKGEILDVFEKANTPKRHMEKTSMGLLGDEKFFKSVKELKPELDFKDIHFIITGIEAHICVMQTVQEILNRGSKVFLVEEAISCRGEKVREYAFLRMVQSGAVLTNGESVGFEWARDKNHPKFKEMSNLMKEYSHLNEI